MTARLLEAPKGLEAKAFEQWWSAKGRRVCNSRSSVKKIKSSIPTAGNFVIQDLQLNNTMDGN